MPVPAGIQDHASGSPSVRCSRYAAISAVYLSTKACLCPRGQTSTKGVSLLGACLSFLNFVFNCFQEHFRDFEDVVDMRATALHRTDVLLHTFDKTHSSTVQVLRHL